jgi:nucleoside-diphosphate kinase
MIKPDGVQRRLVGKIVQRFEEKGLRLAGMRLARLDRATAENLYSVHKGRPFYETLVKFVTSGPVVLLALEGHKAFEVARKLMGATFGFNAEPGTIRGDYGSSKGFNLIHGSDSAESAARELALFFTEKDCAPCDHADLAWVLEEPERA